MSKPTIVAAVLFLSAAAVQAQEVVDSDMPAEPGAHALARNTDQGGFLLVWAPRGDGQVRPIRMKRFDAKGVGIGLAVEIDQTDIPAGTITTVAAAYGDEKYLVVWRDERQAGSLSSEIYGRMIDKEGNPVAGSFRISDLGGNGPDAWPSVAFDGEKFIVAWAHRHIPPANGGFTSSFVENDDIRARFVKPNGGFVGASFAYSTEAVDSTKPSIASLGDKRSMSTWEDHPGPGKPGQVWGARTDESGNNKILVPYAIGGGADQERPRLVANPATKNYLLVWKGSESEKGGGNIWYRKIKEDGKYDGGKQQLTVVGSRVGRVSIAYDAKVGQLIIAWDTGDGAAATDIGYVRVNPVSLSATSQKFQASPNWDTRDYGVEIVASGTADLHGAYLRQSNEGGDVELVAGNIQMAPRHGKHENKCSATTTVAFAPAAARLLFVVFGIVVLQTVRRRRRKEREDD